MNPAATNPAVRGGRVERATSESSVLVELDLDGTVVGLAGKNNDTAEALSLDPQSIMDRANAGRTGQ